MASPSNSSGLLQVDNDGGGGVTLIAPFEFTAGRSAVFTLGHFATSQTITGVTIGGTAAVLDASSNKFQTTNSSVRIYRAANMVGRTDEIVITYSGGTDNYISGSVEEWDGLLTVLSGTPNSAEAFSVSPAVSTGADVGITGAIVYAAMAPGDSNAAQGIGGPAGWNATWTEQNNSSHQSGRGAWIEEGTSGVKTAPFTRSASNPWGAAIVAYELVTTPLEQEGFRFGADDGSESTHSFLADQDVSVTQPADHPILLDFLLNVSGSPGAKTFRLQHRKVGDTTWIDTPIQ